MLKENLTITKEDSNLTKLCKFCAWFSIVICFLIFAIVWLILFIVLGGFTFIYKCFHIAYLNHKNTHKVKITEHIISENKDKEQELKVDDKIKR